MSLDWQEDLATGIENIDNQHREIFARFALFSAACSDGKGGDELLRLMNFLSEYTVEHIRDEEEAMSAAEYPRLAEQEKEHAAFLDGFVRLRKLVEENGPSQEIILNEKRAMIRWLINHICHVDRAFADFLTATRHQPPVAHPA
jgi:hemerythrin